ncbi:MAG TPA: hypothetical protein VMV00_00390 [Candidatus Baltobacteraceae bacterium]|nr:hypothetical protein [Candidatus Baltobacteraceae bacterium]
MLYLWLNVILAFIVGTIWIFSATRISDAFGSKLGGFIGSMPSMIMIALVFIGLSEGVPAALKVSYAFPLAYGATGFFLLAYYLLYKRGHIVALGTSFAIWLSISLTGIALKVDDPVHTVAFYLVAYLACYLVMMRFLKSPNVTRPILSSMAQSVLRSVLGGGVVGFVVLVSKISGPVEGGIVGGFPIIFSSMLTIGYLSDGPRFSRALSKSLALTGITTMIYIVSIMYLYPNYGVIAGTVSGYLITIVCGLLIYRALGNG